MDSELPFSEKSHLSSNEIAPRIFFASDGIMRPIMRLLRRAFYISLENGHNIITIDDLKESYDIVLSSRFIEKQNPFQGRFDEKIFESNNYRGHIKSLYNSESGFNNRIKKKINNSDNLKNYL